MYLKGIIPFLPGFRCGLLVAMDILSTYLFDRPNGEKKVHFLSQGLVSGDLSNPPQVVALLASVHVVHRLTAPTPNVTAPDKLTLAALYVSYHVCVVAPPTAQQVAAVRPD